MIVGQGRDVWFAYPRLGDWIHNPGPMLWVKASGFSIIDTQDWPGSFDLDDHSIDTEVARLVRFAASGIEPAT